MGIVPHAGGAATSEISDQFFNELLKREVGRTKCMANQCQLFMPMDSDECYVQVSGEAVFHRFSICLAGAPLFVSHNFVLVCPVCVLCAWGAGLVCVGCLCTARGACVLHGVLVCAVCQDQLSAAVDRMVAGGYDCGVCR